jgi:hypothetical protein
MEAGPGMMRILRLWVNRQPADTWHLHWMQMSNQMSNIVDGYVPGQQQIG